MFQNNNKMKKKCENHQKCMQMIQAVLDGSASEEEVEHFKNNMDECMPCIETYKLEKSVKEAIVAKVEKKCCPESIMVDIRSKIGAAFVIICFLFAEATLYKFLFS
jgi:anti-sigma factor (TIGR02949 family)